MMGTIKVCFVKYAEENWSQPHKEVVCVGHKTISELEKVDSKDEGTCR